jgi:hypothetical protein
MCALNIPTNITNNNATNKLDRREDEEPSYRAQQQQGHTFSSQTISSQEVSLLKKYPFQYHRKIA